MHGPAPTGKRPKTARNNADALWKKWPTAADWPEVLGVDEAAAYLRISTDLIRDLTETDRDGKAQLRHQRIKGRGDREIRRMRKTDLDNLGLIDDRRSRSSPCCSGSHASREAKSCGIAAK